MVFCIHGNKWGVANCCEDFDIPGTGDEDILVSVVIIIIIIIIIMIVTDQLRLSGQG